MSPWNAREDGEGAWKLRPGWWATAEWWRDDDGVHAWFAHDCATERVETMLPSPPWHIVNDQRGDEEVNPSVSCESCGLHTFLLSVDRRERLQARNGPATLLGVPDPTSEGEQP